MSTIPRSSGCLSPRTVITRWAGSEVSAKHRTGDANAVAVRPRNSRREGTNIQSSPYQKLHFGAWVPVNISRGREFCKAGIPWSRPLSREPPLGLAEHPFPPRRRTQNRELRLSVISKRPLQPGKPGLRGKRFWVSRVQSDPRGCSRMTRCSHNGIVGWQPLCTAKPFRAQDRRCQAARNDGLPRPTRSHAPPAPARSR